MRRIYSFFPSFLGSPNFSTSNFTTTSTTKPHIPRTIMSESSEFYSLKAQLPSGKIYDFAELQGKTVLIVNVASNWYVPSWPSPCLRLTIPLRSGFTPQYAGNTHLILPGYRYSVSTCRTTDSLWQIQRQRSWGPWLPLRPIWWPGA